jgi:ParB-like chromosome segregation protein Spo0J
MSVVPLGTAPSAVEAGAAAPREGTSHEDDRREQSARADRPEPNAIAADEQGSHRPPVALGEDLDVEQHRPAERDEAALGGPRCARCGRRGVEVPGDIDLTRTSRKRPAPRTGGASCTMTSAAGAAKPYPISTIGTTLGRARCLQPARIERMKQSLSAHGQLTPLVGTTKPEGVELVDGFKRLAAAKMLDWPTLQLVVRPLDEPGQWVTMLLLNGGPSSMTTLEEALVLREIVKTGLLQSQVASLVTRHKTWVSRRIGLIERLHPELVEAMKLGLLHPGSARRLLSLPPGNQLEMAAAIQKARLGPRDTELFVSLWRQTKDEKARLALLSEPRASLGKHYPEKRHSPLDPRLSPEGQRLYRCLQRFKTAATEMSRRLRTALSAPDRAVLSKELWTAAEAASQLVTELGSARSVASKSESAGTGEMS